MSKIDYERLLRHIPRSQGGTGPEYGTGFAPRGGGIRMHGNVANSVHVGFDVVGTEDLQMKSNETIACDVALVGDETRNLSVFDLKVDGKCLRDFVGHFQDLTIWAEEDVYLVGKILEGTDPSLRVAKLQETWLGKHLGNISEEAWVIITLMLVQIYQNSGK